MAVAEAPGRVPLRPVRKSVFQRARASLGPWAYIAPAGMVMAVISVFPQLFQVWLSFTDFRARNLRFNLFDSETWERFGPNLIGIDNFVRIVTSEVNVTNYDFVRLLGFNVTWTVVNVAFHVSLGIGIAMALNAKRVIGRRVYRALFIIPWALPAYISALTWRNMFDERFGAVNQLIGEVNTAIGTALPTNIDWINDPAAPIGGPLGWLPWAFYAVLIANIWLGWPFMMVVATGALQSIPDELYEAARIDGAGGWQMFRRVTLPLLRPAMVPAVMLGTIWTFNQFNVIYFISVGGPIGKTEILITQAFKIVFENRLYGLAAAFSIVVFFVLLIITLIQNFVTRATESYDLA